jgi:hypothetical protein
MKGNLQQKGRQLELNFSIDICVRDINLSRLGLFLFCDYFPLKLREKHAMVTIQAFLTVYLITTPETKLF